MAGSGSGSGMGAHAGGAGGSGGGGCTDLTFDAEVQATSPPMVTVGDEFNLALKSEGPDIDVVEVVHFDGTSVGSIIDRLDELLPCLRQGVRYGARVERIAASGRPVVRIFAR